MFMASSLRSLAPHTALRESAPRALDLARLRRPTARAARALCRVILEGPPRGTALPRAVNPPFIALREPLTLAPTTLP